MRGGEEGEREVRGWKGEDDREEGRWSVTATVISYEIVCNVHIRCACTCAHIHITHNTHTHIHTPQEGVLSVCVGGMGKG